ncbi:hypothetical protein, partial [Pseudomonas sp. SJZ079]|uniref:hypothetical protein n=1 Tax=Pseudomonas sp. SJZ079 TaxID=2572887 RepID=UPI001C49ADA3
QQGAGAGVFGDCQFTCIPDCQSSLPRDNAKNQKKGLCPSNVLAAAFVGWAVQVMVGYGATDRVTANSLVPGA